MERGGSGIPIVFLHGNGFCKEVFNFQFESNRLSQNRLLAIDLPGHGASPDFDDPFAVYNYAGMAKHVIKTLSTLEWSVRRHLFGCRSLLQMISLHTGV